MLCLAVNCSCTLVTTNQLYSTDGVLHKSRSSCSQSEIKVGGHITTATELERESLLVSTSCVVMSEVPSHVA